MFQELDDDNIKFEHKKSKLNVSIHQQHRGSLKDWDVLYFICVIHITWNSIQYTKKLENGWKEVVWPPFGCAKHPKAGRNTQQIA